MNRGLITLALVSACTVACRGKTDEVPAAAAPTAAPAGPKTSAQGPETPEPTGDAPPTPAPAAATPAKAATGQCTDHSGLDRSALPPLPNTPYTKTFEKVWGTVLEKYYDPTISCLDWPGLRMKYGQRLAEANYWKDVYPILRELLDELDQSHFAIVTPGERPPGERIPRGPGTTGVEARLIGDEIVVTKSASGGPLGGLLPGAVIETIEGEPVSTVIKEARKRWTRPSKVAFEVARGIESMLSCKPAYKWRVRASDPSQGGKPVVRPLDCAFPEGEKVTLGHLRDVPTRVDWRMLVDEEKNTKIGYLHFNVWMLPLVQKVSSAIKELRSKNMQALVLDLRGNPGGVGLMAVPVARHFLLDDGSLGKMKFREFEQDFNVQAEPNPFKGPVVVLVDERTASTSEIFVTGMKDLGRITVVGGRASAGAALPSMIEELERGVILQYVVGDYTSPKGTIVEGKGITPDVLITETREGFENGGDPVLEGAVAHLQQELGAPADK